MSHRPPQRSDVPPEPATFEVTAGGSWPGRPGGPDRTKPAPPKPAPPKPAPALTVAEIIRVLHAYHVNDGFRFEEMCNAEQVSRVGKLKDAIDAAVADRKPA